jgi:hypothetical protein
MRKLSPRLVSRPRSTIAVLVAAVALPGLAVAAITAPELTLERADATRGGSGVLLRLAGSIPQADLVQHPLEIQVLVRGQGSPSYLRFELPGGVFAGHEPSLGGALEAAALPGLVSGSAPAPGPGVLLLAPDRVELMLPSTFPSGPAEAHLFLIYHGEPILSNPAHFVVDLLP